MGVGTENKGVFGGSNQIVLDKSNLPQTALNGVLSGYNIIGCSNYGNPSFGTSSGAQYQAGAGSDGHWTMFYLKSFATQLSANGWNSIPFDNRPAYLNVYYIIKI